MDRRAWRPKATVVFRHMCMSANGRRVVYLGIFSRQRMRRLSPYRAVVSTCTRAFTNVTTPPTCGQPLPHTHPHLFPIDFRRGTDASKGGGVAMDHLTPGIPASEYEDRRRRLMERLPPKSVVVLMGGRIKYMSRNIFYKFRQESNFWVRKKVVSAYVWGYVCY